MWISASSKRRFINLRTGRPPAALRCSVHSRARSDQFRVCCPGAPTLPAHHSTGVKSQAITPQTE
eukprot:COSAG01_NODE_8778_length_2660_cov_51.644809_2_plen_65_part_00